MTDLDTGSTPVSGRDFNLSEIPLKPLVDAARAPSLAGRPLDKDFYYHAGGLFRNDELMGNVYLAGALQQLSGGRITPDLPQMKEANTDPELRSVELIRAKDLHGILLDDMALFMFEGTDLDDGMLVELGLAKALGMPSVVVRTDFRDAGDAGIGHDWNLMCDDWPAHRIVSRVSMDDFAKAVENAEAPTDVSVRNSMYEALGKEVVAAFEELRGLPPVLSGTREQLDFYFRQLLKTYDGSGHLLKLIDDELLAQVIERKAAKGLITIEE